MGAAIDLTGQKFGRWLVIKRYQTIPKTKYLCRCECGTERLVAHGDLRNGKSRSCGCLKRDLTIARNTTHGDSHHERLWRIWNNMKNRCSNPNIDTFHRYGGRGIKVCDEWEQSYESFREWSLSNGYTDNLSIDRIDNDGNYEPNNCRWVTSKIQSRNTVRNNRYSIENETRTLIEWCELHSINYRTVKSRLSRGWSFEDAITREVETKYRRK
jgi:hypothetical protein